MFNKGDLVVGVSEENSNCPHGPHDMDPWIADASLIGKIMRVTAISAADDCPQILRFNSGNDWWCAGCFRKVTKADDKFIHMLRQMNPSKKKESNPFYVD